MNNIAIVIPCYNRLDTLKVLLDSLLNARYDRSVELVFSIDYSGNEDIYNLVDEFTWPYGKKNIIRHKENIGLRRNIISCGDLTSEYDAVIVLEDDLIVSPLFFDYACNAWNYYKEDNSVAGISLYSYRVSETKHEFFPITDGYDTYFVQWTSSWGQLWTKKQWTDFKEWYEGFNDDFSKCPIPFNVKKWNPKNSWKKYHIAYLCENDKFFVYPKESYTTITPTLGFHKKKISLSSPFFVPLCTGKRRDFLFQKSKGAIKYDSFFELKECEIILSEEKVKVDFDLYCDKERNCIANKYFITSKKINGIKELKSWGGLSIPYEQNVLNGVKGNRLFLYHVDDFYKQELNTKERQSMYIITTGRDYFNLIVESVKTKYIIKLKRILRFK